MNVNFVHLKVWLIYQKYSALNIADLPHRYETWHFSKTRIGYRGEPEMSPYGPRDAPGTRDALL